jgi:hypothetical protein
MLLATEIIVSISDVKKKTTVKKKNTKADRHCIRCTFFFIIIEITPLVGQALLLI